MVISLNCLIYTSRVRELTTAKIGTLLRITGQVVRTHPVHPELVSGTFMCLECRTIIKDVEQQFKYTQVQSNLYTEVRYNHKSCYNDSFIGMNPLQSRRE